LAFTDEEILMLRLIIAILVTAAVCISTGSHAQQLVESYIALLSEADHFNSNGQRLTSAAAIIRQDRANFHRYGIRDPEDQGDTFFADEGNRSSLERMLERGQADPGVIARIVNGRVLIRVDIYRNPTGPFVRVTVLDMQQPKADISKPVNEDYVGPFTTEYLYALCSQNDTSSREKCNLYIQGLLYGLNTAKTLREKGTTVCLPDMTPEAARLRILSFIDAITANSPSNNKDGGDWMAFMGVAAGNLCK
jgi:hypothetical protein